MIRSYRFRCNKLVSYCHHVYLVRSHWPFWLIGRWGFDYNLKLMNFKLISTINIWSISCEIAIRWMPQHLTDHQSTLVQLMAWCHKSTSHYLSQCWPRSLSPYDVTKPQWVKWCVINVMIVLIIHNERNNDIERYNEKNVTVLSAWYPLIFQNH